MNHRRLLVTATTAGLLGGSMLVGLPAASAQSSSTSGGSGPVHLHADLHPLNRSGASGDVEAVVNGTLIRSLELEAEGLSPNAPHAVHIHYGDDARNECPTMAEATNTRRGGVPRLSTADGLPAYGPIVVSLTTRGNTLPSSALAVDRFPVSRSGELEYERNNIRFTDVAGTGYPGANGTGTAAQIAEAIRDGEGVVVVHGVDYNRNGRYDFASAGRSELNSSLPAEATDPAACGVLR